MIITPSHFHWVQHGGQTYQRFSAFDWRYSESGHERWACSQETLELEQLFQEEVKREQV